MKELEQRKIPSTYGEALILAGHLQIENEQLSIYNNEKELLLIEQKPKVEFFDSCFYYKSKQISNTYYISD